MEFRILGPLEVSDGTAVSLPSGKSRTLLLALLLRRNAVVPTDLLIEDLWDGDPPATATKMIQHHVSQLRKGPLAERIRTQPPGYLLQVEDDELDVARAHDLMDRARTAEPEQAAAFLREALALWRGRPLIDVAYEDFAQAEIDALEELRLTCLELRLDADLALGRHRELVGELETLVAEHPLRERFQEQLMLALYRSGRQAEALDVYRRARRRLVEQLGIEPGVGLQELERGILDHDPKLGAPAPPRAVSRRRRLALPLALAATAAAVAAAVAALGGAAQAKLAANTAVRYDPAGKRTAAVPVGETPRAVAVGAAGVVWVANYGDHTVSRVDRKLHAGQPVGTGDAPSAVAVGEGAVWVVSPFDGRLSRLDPTSGRITAVIPVGDVSGIAAGAGGIWLTNQTNGTLRRVDPGTLQISVFRRGLSGPAGVAVSSGDVWVAESFSHELLRFEPADRTAAPPIHLKLAPDAVAVGDGAVWVTNPGDNEVTRVDLQSGAARLIAVGTNPIDVAVARSHVWVVNDLDHSLSELDPRTGNVQRTISFTDGRNYPARVHLTPGGIAAAGENVWVTVQRF